MYLDTHIHILPGVDDGPVDVGESVEMARVLVDLGWSGAVATPHIRPGFCDEDPEQLRSRARVFSSTLEEQGIALHVLPGAEHYLDSIVYERVLAGRSLPLGGKGSLLLIEAPITHPVPNLAEKVFAMRLKGITPVFAHPERCHVFSDLGLASYVVQAGAHLQLNLGSLAGAYGRSSRALARQLLDRGLYSVAATDLHGAKEALDMLGAWVDDLTGAVGPKLRDRLLGENPRRLLEGREAIPLGAA